MPVVEETYDIVVVGAGHAGCEAALAAARLGFETIMFTVSVDCIALMPCNPNVGGSSKGHLVRELDALGGAVVEVHMCQANATKALVHHDRRDAATHPGAQVAIGRVLGLAAGKLRDQFAQTGEQQAKAVVLRGNLHATAHQVHNRLVTATVTELKLFHLSATRQADHLVTKANAKDRHLADQLLHLLVGLHHGIGITGAVG